MTKGATELRILLFHFGMREANQQVTCAIWKGFPELQSPSNLKATLNAVLKQSISNARAVFSYPDPGGARDRDGNPKTTNFIPSIEMVGHPSPALVNDIELGQLHDITLVDQRPQNQLGRKSIPGRERATIEGEGCAKHAKPWPSSKPDRSISNEASGLPKGQKSGSLIQME